jgi:hypothetical protein
MNKIYLQTVSFFCSFQIHNKKKLKLLICSIKNYLKFRNGIGPNQQKYSSECSTSIPKKLVSNPVKYLYFHTLLTRQILILPLSEIKIWLIEFYFTSFLHYTCCSYQSFFFYFSVSCLLCCSITNRNQLSSILKHRLINGKMLLYWVCRCFTSVIY